MHTNNLAECKNNWNIFDMSLNDTIMLKFTLRAWRERRTALFE